MSPSVVSAIVFGCVFGGSLVGLRLRSVLPDHHLGADSKDAVKVAMGVVATMAALVLGLLVASAKESFDMQRTELTQVAANAVVLDRLLAHYGPEAAEARTSLRVAAERLLDVMWAPGSPSTSSAPTSTGGEMLFERIQSLTPKDDAQRALQSQAQSQAIAIGQMRWLMFEQRTGSVSLPLLIVLVAWLTLIAGSFGLFAPTNATVIATLGLSAVSVSLAIFLILEMYAPYGGMIRVSDAPLRAAIAQLGK
jgi:hypothetical protein